MENAPLLLGNFVVHDLECAWHPGQGTATRNAEVHDLECARHLCRRGGLLPDKLDFYLRVEPVWLYYKHTISCATVMFKKNMSAFYAKLA